MKNEFMKRAIELSIESVKSGTGPFGALIVKDNKIISEGFNQVTSTNDPTAHGEIVAIRQACKNLNHFKKCPKMDISISKKIRTSEQINNDRSYWWSGLYRKCPDPWIK